MGYMGFGLRKEDYKRKPKTVFNRQKELYGDKLEKYPKVSRGYSLKKHLEDLENFKNKRRNRSKISDSIIGILAAFAIIFLIWIMLYWLGENFSR